MVEIVEVEAKEEGAAEAVVEAVVKITAMTMAAGAVAMEATRQQQQPLRHQQPQRLPYLQVSVLLHCNVQGVQDGLGTF